MPWELAPLTEFAAGQPVLVPKDARVLRLQLNSREMSAVPGHNYLLGVAPLDNDRVLVHGVYRRVPSFSLHPLRFSFAALVPIIHLKEKKQAQALQLPKQTWQKLESEEALEQRKKDRERNALAFSSPWPPLSTKCWQRPLKARVTSPFGSPRRLPDGQIYYHWGQDLRASIGTPVVATGPGIVRFAGEMVVPGKNIVISHGEGFFTRYMHLSEVKVQENQFVSAGELLGLTGASGRVEAPHLHWEILWKGSPADPEKFLEFWAKHCSD